MYLWRRRCQRDHPAEVDRISSNTGWPLETWGRIRDTRRIWDRFLEIHRGQFGRETTRPRISRLEEEYFISYQNMIILLIVAKALDGQRYPCPA